MLLERNQALIGLIAAFALGVGTLFAVALSGGMFKPGIELEGEFTDAAGLKPGSFVFVAGVRAGEVTSVEIDGQQVRATFTLQAEGIPDDSTVTIIPQNTLGKRALKVDPGSSSDAFEPGDVIPVERTSTPVSMPELGDRSAELLGEVNVDALQDLITSLADVTEGQADEVARLLDGVERVTRVVADRRDDLARVIQRSETFVDAAADKDAELVAIIDDFGSTLDVLARRRTDVSRLLEETATTTSLTSDLLEDRRGQIDRVLSELHEDLGIVDAHQVDLAHLLAYTGVGIEGFASIGYGNGPAKTDNPGWGNVFTTGVGAIGADALFGCGGTFDEAFTELIGPDPRCTEDRPGNPPQGDGGQQGATTEQSRYGGVDRFFQPTGGDA